MLILPITVTFFLGFWNWKFIDFCWFLVEDSWVDDILTVSWKSCVAILVWWFILYAYNWILTKLSFEKLKKKKEARNGFPLSLRLFVRWGYWFTDPNILAIFYFLGIQAAMDSTNIFTFLFLNLFKTTKLWLFMCCYNL